MSQFYFPRNDQSAQKANASNRLSPHEFHAVKITQAYWGVSQNGAKFIALNLMSASHETADEIKVYFANANNEQLSGYHQINAILALNNIAGLNQVQGTYKTYDFEHGGLTDRQGLIAPELIGTYVGVILSENYYHGQNGVKHNLNLSAVYHHQTGQNAKQFLQNMPVVQGQIEQSIAYAKKSSQTSKDKAEREAQHQGGQSWNTHQGGHWGNTAPQGQQRPIGMTSSLYQPPHSATTPMQSAPQPITSPTPPTPPMGQVPDEDMPF